MAFANGEIWLAVYQRFLLTTNHNPVQQHTSVMGNRLRTRIQSLFAIIAKKAGFECRIV